MAEACFRRVGIEDIEVDDACRTVTGLLSLLDALRGASWASAMAIWEFVVECDQGFFDRSHNGRGICMLCLRQSEGVVLAIDLDKCRSESDVKSKRLELARCKSEGAARCQGVGRGSNQGHRNHVIMSPPRCSQKAIASFSLYPHFDQFSGTIQSCFRAACTKLIPHLLHNTQVSASRAILCSPESPSCVSPNFCTPSRNKATNLRAVSSSQQLSPSRHRHSAQAMFHQHIQIPELSPSHQLYA